MTFEEWRDFNGIVYLTQREVDVAREAYDAATQAALRRASEIASNESEPDEGHMPAEIIERVIDQDTVYVERAIIAAVRATKKNIVRDINREAERGRE